MDYQTRILPHDEWHRLADTEMASVTSMNAEAVTVVIAEDKSGAIVGCWGLVNFAHLEGMWVHPDHRRRGVVLRRLWNDICALAATRGLGAVFTGAATPDVARWIEKRGGQKVPFDSFVLPLKPVGRV